MVAPAITVVQMLPDLDEGGVEQGTLEIGNALCRSGHRSLVISRGGRMVHRLETEGSTHITMPFIGEKTPRSLLHIGALRKLFVQYEVDILHLRSRLPAWVAYLAVKSLPRHLRPKLVTTFHGFYSVNAYSAIMTKGERVIAVSRVIAKHIHEVYGVPHDRISTIHRGVDPEVLDPRHVTGQRIERLQQHWGLGGCRTPVLLIPARVTRLKGHDLLIQALSRFTNRRWTLICAGDYDSESSYFQQLLELCRELNISSQVHFVGHCDDMPAAIRWADLIVSASTKPESFGRTTIEAQALERAVVAPDHGGSMETIVHGETGWLFKPNDIESLMRALEEALADQRITAQFGSRGRQRVLERFTLSRMCRSTLELYEELLTQ